MSNALSRELGDALRQARHQAHVSAGTMAEELGWSIGKISKLEGGTRGTSAEDIARFVGYLRADPAVYQHIMTLTHEMNTGCFVRPHGVAMPDSLRMLIMNEREARTISSYEIMVILGLLQTPDYARALMTEAEADECVRNRMERQKIFDGMSAPEGNFFIHEAALHRMVGSPQVMYEQVLQLLFRGRVRLVPLRAAVPAALNSHFLHMTFADYRPLTYTENGPVSVFMETAEATKSYQESCACLDRIALSEAESRAWFAKWADRYDRLRDAVTGSGVVA